MQVSSNIAFIAQKTSRFLAARLLKKVAKLETFFYQSKAGISLNQEHFTEKTNDL